MIAVTGITTSTSIVSAQSATGSFNPLTQLQVGSRIVIRSVYGIATPRPQGGTGQSHNWNQSQQNLPTYNASITIDLQITGENSNGGIQFTVQGGVMVIDTSTIAITGGKGEMSSIDRVMMEGTATSTSSQSLNWRMNGLAALLNGALISELTGNTSTIINGIPTNVIVTCIATIS
jgi:hypothetical protein